MPRRRDDRRLAPPLSPLEEGRYRESPRLLPFLALLALPFVALAIALLVEAVSPVAGGIAALVLGLVALVAYWPLSLLP
jgi:hypothetical protein